MKSKLILSTLKKVTKREYLALQTKSFKSTIVEISFETESSKINFYQFDDVYYGVDVFDKELQKTVSLYFNFDGESSVQVFVHFYKKKRSIVFWKKPTLKIVRTISYEIFEQNEDDENIIFVYERVPLFVLDSND